MKRILLAVLLALGVSVIYAQSGAVGFTYGIFAGTTSTNVNTNFAYDNKTSGAGFTAGAFARIKVLFFQVVPEVAYTTKAVSLTSSRDAVLNQAKFNSKNIDVNALININIIPLGDLAKLRLQAGLGDCINLESSIEQAGIVTNAENSKNSYWNGLLGVGVDVLKLTADLRYSFAFSDISNSPTIKVTPSTIFLTIGLKFR